MAGCGQSSILQVIHVFLLLIIAVIIAIVHKEMMGVEKLSGYYNSQGDNLYDDMRQRKIYMRKGMDCYTEWVEGIPIVRRALVTKADSTKMTLDEWAAEYGVDCSTIIALLKSALYVSERKEEGRRMILEMGEYYAEVAV